MHPEAAVVGDELGEDLGGVVGGRVVHDEQLDQRGELVVSAHLLEQGADAAAEVSLLVMGHEHEAQPWHVRPSRGGE